MMKCFNVTESKTEQILAPEVVFNDAGVFRPSLYSKYERQKLAKKGSLHACCGHACVYSVPLLARHNTAAQNTQRGPA